MSASRRLLESVRSRQIFGSFLRRLTLFIFIFGGLYAALLLTSRLTGLLPDYFAPFTIGAPFAVALLAALIFARRPRPEETAHLVDTRADKKDLFLTSVRLADSMGDYQSLVSAQAEREAASLRPSRVAPLLWQRPATVTFCAIGLLLAGIFFLPQLDPFKKQEARNRLAERQREIEETRKAIATRAEILAKKELDSELSKETEQRLAQVRDDLESLKPETPKENQLTLNKDMKETARDWREANEKRLKDALDRNPTSQRFGAADKRQMDLQQQLQMGKTDGLAEEMKKVAEMMQQMQKMPANNEREQLRQQVRERLQDLAQFAQRQANNMPMNAAMQQALDQLALAGDPQLAQVALEAAQQALQLGEKELQALAQNIRDIQKLEEALKALQLAKQANGDGKLPGDGQGKGMGIGEYAALYAKLIEGQAEAEGGAFGNPGHGAGGQAPENEEAKTDFKTEQEKVALQAGKVLMEWKVQGEGPVGKADVTYLEKVAALKQGASEAILKEQVPPGYHDAITKYFDTIGESAASSK